MVNTKKLNDVSYDQNIADNAALIGAETVGLVLAQRVQVQAHAGQVVFGLTDVHPEAGQLHGVQLRVVAHVRKDLLLYGHVSQLDAIENGRIEDVEAGVDLVRDELLGLLDEALDAARVVVVDDDAVLGRLLDLGDHDGALALVSVMKGEHLLERKLAYDVAVEHEERLARLVEVVLGERERTGRAERLLLLRHGDLDAQAGRLHAHLLLQHVRQIAHRQYDLVDARLGQRLDLMQHHRLVGELDQRLRLGQRQRTEACAVATYKNQCLHYLRECECERACVRACVYLSLFEEKIREKFCKLKSFLCLCLR